MKILITLLFGLFVLNGIGQVNFPITLSLPFDQDTITETEPTFVWQCNLSAVQSDPRLTLQFVMVELQNGQTAAEAISTNQPICVLNGLLSTSYTYQGTQHQLEKGKTYVWQVQMSLYEQPVQQSEPWKFTIDDPKKGPHQFMTMKVVPDGSFYTFPDGHAWLLLKEGYDFSSQNAKVRKPNNQLIPVTIDKVLADGTEDDGGLFNENGFSYLHCNLESIPKGKGIYTLELTAKSGKSYLINFVLE